MKKTQATILINSRKTVILNVDDLVSLVFYKRNKQALSIPATIILNKIIVNGVKDSDWKDLTSELNITYTVYRGILKHLEAIGMIEKRQGLYQPSKRFCNALNGISSYYNALVESSHIGQGNPTS